MIKWDEIIMKFITKLPRTSKGHDFISVMVDCLTKSARFIPTKESLYVDRLAYIYIKKVVKFHGVPNSIVSDRDSRFTS